MPYNYYQPYQPYQPNIPQINAYQAAGNQQIPNIPQQAVVQQPQQPPMQIQNGGFISVRSLNEAFNYPVAPGNSVTFKDENAPFVYTKTMGFSQLDRPIFKKFRLVEEETEAGQPTATQSSDISAIPQQNIDLSLYAKIADIEPLRAKYDDISTIVEKMNHEIERLRFDIDAVSTKSTKKMVQAARKDADEE